MFDCYIFPNSKKGDENIPSWQLGVFDELWGVQERGKTLLQVFHIIFVNQN